MMGMTDTRYQIYQTLTKDLTRILRKALGKPKHYPSAEAIARLFAFQPEMLGTMDTLVLAEEFFWERSGKHVIFPLPEVVDQLLDAQYQLGAEALFDWPYESCILALPSAGPLADIPGALVTWHRSGDRTKRITDPFIKGHKVNVELEERMDPALNEDDMVIAINYRIAMSADGDMGCARAVFPASRLPFLLASDDPFDFLIRLGSFGVYKGEESLTPQEASVQLRLLKLIAGMALLNGIAPNTLLQPGLPGIRFAGAEKLPKGALGVRFLVPQADKTPRVGHHRRWHFRTLRDERFYQGEHAHKPRGSRVIFVSDALVGEGESETLG